MEKRARYEVLSDTREHLLIRDLGPWDVYPTVANDVEAVVADLRNQLGNRRLFYIDSEGEIGEIIVEKGRFSAFALLAQVETAAIHGVVIAKEILAVAKPEFDGDIMKVKKPTLAQWKPIVWKAYQAMKGGK